MRKQKKPQCMLYSFAECFGLEIEELIRLVGHDGLEKIQGQLRGISSQEFVDVGLQLGYAVVTLDAYPVNVYQDSDVRIPVYAGNRAGIRLVEHIAGRKAVIEGEYQGRQHACAWDGFHIHDPNMVIQDLSNIQIRTVYLILPITS